MFIGFILYLTDSRFTHSVSLFSNFNVDEFLSSGSPVKADKLPPSVLKGAVGLSPMEVKLKLITLTQQVCKLFLW